MAGLSIRGRLMTGMGILCACLIATSVLSLMQLRTVSTAADQVSNKYLATSMALGRLNASVEQAGGLLASMTFDLSENDRFAQTETMDRVSAGIRSSLARYRDLSSTDTEKRFSTALDRRLADFTAVEDRFRKLVADHRLQEAGFVYIEDLASAQQELRVAIHRSLNYSAAQGDKQVAYGHQVTTDTFWMLLAGLACSCVFTVLCVGWLDRTLAQPVRALAAMLRRMASRDYAFTAGYEAQGHEIGDIARAVDELRGSLQANDAAAATQDRDRAVRDLRTQRIATSTVRIESVVGQLAGMVASAATQLQATAGEMSGAATDAHTRSTRMAEAALVSSSAVDAVAAAAEQLSASIGEISHQVVQSETIARGAMARAKRTQEVVGALSQGAKQIDSVISLISSIARQTNLLALNATIEAARAGEVGKGFAVVASEVKNLANQTAGATENILNHVAEVQRATAEAVSAIQDISGTIEELGITASAIAAAVEEQNAATSEIARNVREAARGSGQVTGAIDDLASAATSNGDSANSVRDAAKGLAGNAERLSSEVNEFIAELAAA